MDFNNYVYEVMDKAAQECWNEFMSEISTDENKDYRRGFKAGLLCSHLYLKSELSKYKLESKD